MADIVIAGGAYRPVRQVGSGSVAGGAGALVRSVAEALWAARSKRARKPMAELHMGLSGSGMPEAFIAW